MPMPRRYIAEMYCDRVAACRTYQKGAYTDLSPIRYFYKGSGKELMHPETRRDIGFLLTLLGEKGEKATADYIKNEYLKGTSIPEDYKELESLNAFDAACNESGKALPVTENGCRVRGFDAECIGQFRAKTTDGEDA